MLFRSPSPLGRPAAGAAPLRLRLRWRDLGASPRIALILGAAALLGGSLYGLGPLLMPRHGGSSPAKPVAASTTPATLTIRTRGRSWLEVRGKNDTVLYSGELDGTRVFPLVNSLRLRSGRADRVRLEVSGQPATPMGPFNFYGWVTIAPPQPSSNPLRPAGSRS